MESIFTFTIPALTPSNNKLVKGRAHWTAYRKMREDWFYLVKLGSQDLDIPPAENMERRRVAVTSYRVSLLDEDNLEGGMKLLWDAMVDAGYLFDDGPKFLEKETPVQIRVRKKRDEKTVLKLTVY